MNTDSVHATCDTPVSCGGVVIYCNKVLLLYKNQNDRHVGWVLPKGSVEMGETKAETALREVKEEGGVSAKIISFLGSTQYSFSNKNNGRLLAKTVHWYLMSATSFECKPQAEEFFADAGYYKRHEAEYLLKFHDEKQIMRKAFAEYDKKLHEER